MVKKKFLVDYPELVKRLHPTKNKDLILKNITFRSSKIIWWKCPIADDHEWESRVYSVTLSSDISNKIGCPYCAGKKVSISNCLATIHPEIAVQWHPTKNGDLTPYDVTGFSNMKVWWKCDRADDHSWKASISNRTGINKNGCACCKGLIAVESNCLATTFPEIASEWCFDKNDITPNDVTAGSDKPICWKCKLKGHEWITAPSDRTGKNKTGCPHCAKSKGENAVESILCLMGLKYEAQFQFDECRNIRPLKFDFCVHKDGRKFLIEFMGEQHYNKYRFEKDNTRLNIRQNRDDIKRKFCKNKHPLLEISYLDFNSIEPKIRDFLES